MSFHYGIEKFIACLFFDDPISTLFGPSNDRGPIILKYRVFLSKEEARFLEISQQSKLLQVMRI